MKKFEFSLERVLDFKNQMLDREKNELARLRREKLRIEENLKLQEQDFQVLSREMTEKGQAGTTILILKSYQFQLDQIRMEQKLLQEKLCRQEEEIARQLETVLAMSRDVSGLDKLKDHQREEYLKAESKISGLEIEEFVSGRLVRQMEAQGAG